MIYFKHANGSVWAFDTEQAAALHGPTGLHPITAEEALTTAKPTMSREQVEALRLQAYADPLTGCDRHFAEATRLAAMGSPAAEVEAARSAGAERYLAIQQEYPYP